MDIVFIVIGVLSMRLFYTEGFCYGIEEHQHLQADRSGIKYKLCMYYMGALALE